MMQTVKPRAVQIFVNQHNQFYWCVHGNGHEHAAWKFDIALTQWSQGELNRLLGLKVCSQRVLWIQTYGRIKRSVPRETTN